MARLRTTMGTIQTDAEGLVKQLSSLENPTPASVICKHTSTDQTYRDTAYSRLQAAGFARRHGWAVVDAEGSTDVPEDADTSSARSEDLSSPGEIDWNPNTAGAPQATGASAIAGKAVRKAGSCEHGVITRKTDGGVFCHGCRKTWPDYKSFEAEQERRRAAGDSDATDKSNQSQTLRKKAKGFDHSDDSLRDELSQKLYKAAGTETNRERRNTIERFAQKIDSGTLPIPRNLAARTGAVRLSTGKRIGGSGRHGWFARHGRA
jgi:hypothetical protein